MKSKYILVTSIEHLKELLTEPDSNFGEFFISMGILRSSKGIRYYPKKRTFDVFNYSDGTELLGLTEKRMRTETNILDAISKKAFYREW